MSNEFSAENFPQMRGAQDNDIVPGPIIGPAPKPREIVCIQVDKIFDACSQRHCFEDVRFRFDELCDDVECRVVPNTFKFECELRQVQMDPPLVRASLTFSFIVEATCDDETRRVRVESEDFIGVKQVILFGLADENFCKVEAVLECLGCDVFRSGNDTIAECDIGVFLEVKTAAHVQLLVPSFGFCPVPPECQELPTRCEEFLEGPPPRRFPPQPFEFDDDDNDFNDFNDNN